MCRQEGHIPGHTSGTGLRNLHHGGCSTEGICLADAFWGHQTECVPWLYESFFFAAASVSKSSPPRNVGGVRAFSKTLPHLWHRREKLASWRLQYRRHPPCRRFLDTSYGMCALTVQILLLRCSICIDTQSPKECWRC